MTIEEFENRFLQLPSPTIELKSDVFSQRNIQVYIKRDDLIHSEISGNKWRKLKFNIERFYQGKYDRILTFGGAFSNHIAATAAACNYLKIPVIGIIRGDELNQDSNKTLRTAAQNRMKLVFVSREKYKERYEQIYHDELRNQYGNVLIIPEGGANHLGVNGSMKIVQELNFSPDYIYLGAGTGTTAAGVLASAHNSITRAVAVLKNGEFLKDDIQKLLYYSFADESFVSEMMGNLDLLTDYHFGGYGVVDEALSSFIIKWEQEYDVPLDQIYTAKAFFAFMKDFEEGKIRSNSKVLLLHTGGLQGVNSN